MKYENRIVNVIWNLYVYVTYFRIKKEVPANNTIHTFQTLKNQKWFPKFPLIWIRNVAV